MTQKPIYRLLMEEKIGRKLKTTEIVHHIDGNMHNNDISNLEIVSRRAHNKKKHPTDKDWEKVISGMLVDDINVGARYLNEHLSSMFTERQKQIILRRTLRLPLSKTEKEYYSRAIKGKLVALSSPILHKFAYLMLMTKP